jgi:ABC-type amino acid transport substrate-binding protein
MHRLVQVGLVITAMLAATASPAQTLTGTLKKVKDTGTLTIGYRENALPFSFTGSDGQPAGYSIDLCREIAADIERELKMSSLAVKWLGVAPDKRVDAVTDGTVDLECGTTTASLSRQEKVDFSLMTFVDGASLLIAQGSGIESAKDLTTKRIGVVAGTTTAKVLADYLREYAINATVVPVKDHDEGLAELQASRLDAYASDRVMLIGMALQSRGTQRFALVAEPLSYEPYAFMLRRDDAAFRLVVNRTLARIYRSGAIGAIYAKWLGALGKPTPVLLLMYALQGLPE